MGIRQRLNERSSRIGDKKDPFPGRRITGAFSSNAADERFRFPVAFSSNVGRTYYASVSTTTVARAEWKYCSELELDLDPKLLHAIEEKRQRNNIAELGKITFRTRSK